MPWDEERRERERRRRRLNPRLRTPRNRRGGQSTSARASSPRRASARASSPRRRPASAARQRTARDELRGLPAAPAAAAPPTPSAPHAAPTPSPETPRGLVIGAENISYPRGADRPDSRDVILVKGRSGATFYSHPGNRLFRNLINRAALAYGPKASQATKRAVRANIVSTIMSCGGSFLLYDAKSNVYSEADVEKVEQVLLRKFTDVRPTARKFREFDRLWASSRPGMHPPPPVIFVPQSNDYLSSAPQHIVESDTSFATGVEGGGAMRLVSPDISVCTEAMSVSFEDLVDSLSHTLGLAHYSQRPLSDESVETLAEMPPHEVAIVGDRINHVLGVGEDTLPRCLDIVLTDKGGFNHTHLGNRLENILVRKAKEHCEGGKTWSWHLIFDIINRTMDAGGRFLVRDRHGNIAPAGDEKILSCYYNKLRPKSLSKSVSIDEVISGQIKSNCTAIGQ